MLAVLAVAFGTVAALFGAFAAVGWQRAARAEARVRQAGKAREAVAEALAVLATRPPGDVLVSRR